MNDNLIAKFNYIKNQFYITKNQNNEIRYWIKEGKTLRKITRDSSDIKIIQEIIKNLNYYRYMLIGNIRFRGENYLWYINTYILQSIFVSRITKKICEYEENKELYDNYNFNPNILYISEKTKTYFNEHIKPKAKIIKVAVLGIIISVTLTSSGCEYLSRNRLDESTINNSKQEELDVTEMEDIKIGTTTEKLLGAISNNQNLMQEEKDFISQNFKTFFDDSKEYMIEDEIIDTLENLKIKYDYKENLADGTAGEYDRGHNEITFYVGNNIHEVKEYSKTVPMHEVFHSIQSFGFGKLNEGMTEVYAEEYGETKSTAFYPNEKLWAKLMLEVFGKDLIMQDSLNNSNLPENIPEKIASLSDGTTVDTARNDMLELITDINDSIEYLEKKKYLAFYNESQENIQDEQKIESVFKRLKNYDRILNGRDTNNMLNIYIDAILKTNSSKLLENEGEYIFNIHKNYFIDQEETIKVEINNSNGGYPYQKKDESGNVIQSGKIPYRNVIIDTDGNVVEKEDIDITIQNIFEEYNKEQDDLER